MPSGYSVLENVAVEDDKFCVVKNGHNSACVKFSLDDLNSTDRTIKFPDSDETIGHPKANNITEGAGDVNIATTSGNIQISGDEGVDITTNGNLTVTGLGDFDFVNAGGITLSSGDGGVDIDTTGSIKLDGDSVDIDAGGSITLDGTDNSNLSMTANSDHNKTLNIRATNYGTGHADVYIYSGRYISLMCDGIGNTYGITLAPLPAGGVTTLLNGAVYNTGYALNINGTANALGWYASSDDRLKENEFIITDATTTLKKLNPQTYLKKQSMDTTDTTNAIEESGLIAQDIYYQVPELRHLINLADDASPAPSITIPSDPTQDPDYSSWGSKPSSINYTGLIAYLVKSVQELSARIDVLEAN